jgi:hypothetical protein
MAKGFMPKFQLQISPRHRGLCLPALLLTCLASGPVFGACSNPAGNEANIIYNGDHHTYQFCNGTNWKVFGGTPANGLVGWWKLDDGSGTTATDSSGYGSSGTLTDCGPGLPTWNTPGKIGIGDLVFTNGTGTNNGNLLTIGAGALPSILGTSSSFTVTAWINMSSVIPNGQDDWIMANYNTNYTPGWAWVFKGSQDCTGVNLQDNLVLALSADGSNYTAAWCGTTIFATNTWYFVAGVYDSSVPTVHLYVNGIDDGGVSYAGATPSSLAHPPGGMGIAGGGACGGAFNGQIDDARVYNVALSAAQIAALYATANACVSPAGKEGDQIYSSGSHTWQFCNGTSWVAFGGHLSPLMQ